MRTRTPLGRPVEKREPFAIQNKSTIELTVNGRATSGSAESRHLLSDFLRHELGLTGTHVGCEHGVCGACTVLIDGEPVRSCLVFAVQCQGATITTVEGLAEEDGALHPLQRAFQEAHALQCGFCTPGFLMSLLPVLEEWKGSDTPTEAEIRDALGGNLCRCTGYQNIVEAVRLAHAEMNRSAPAPSEGT